MSVQLEFFQDNSEEALNRREIDNLREYITRSNRAQFRRMGEIQKLVIEQEARLDRIAIGMIKEVK